MKGLLEIVSCSQEFESVPLRRHEDILIQRIYDRVPVKLQNELTAPNFKTFVLLQAHFSRLQLPPDLAADQSVILGKILNLLSAAVDVMSSNAWLNAIGAMDLSQMCVQALWETDSPLKQIPHFEADVRGSTLLVNRLANASTGSQALQRSWGRIGLRHYGIRRRATNFNPPNGCSANVSTSGINFLYLLTTGL